MGIIIRDNKIVKAMGSIDEIVADFNEYLKFIAEEQHDSCEESCNNSIDTKFVKDLENSKDKELISKLKENIMQYKNTLELEKKAKEKEAANSIIKAKQNNTISTDYHKYKYGDIAFIIRRENDNTAVNYKEVAVDITLAKYDGFVWHSLNGNLVQIDSVDIILVEDNTSILYLKRCFNYDTKTVQGKVKFNY